MYVSSTIFIQVPEKEVFEEVITDWNFNADEDSLVQFDSNGDLTNAEVFWDGKSADARLGMLFLNRKAVKDFMALYKQGQNCQYCVMSGGVSDKCMSKKVGLLHKISVSLEA